MNQFKNLLIICILINLLSACSDDKDTENKEPYFNIAEEYLYQSFDSDAYAQYVTVNTNKLFTATSSDPSWCTVDIIDDKVDNIKISVNKNEMSADREAEIVVSSTGFENITIQVKQNWTSSFSVDKSYVLLNNDNPEFTLKVTGNVEYKVEIPDWIQETGEPVNGTHTFKASLIAPSERSGDIVFKATDETSDKKLVVSVIQRERIKKIGSWLFENSEDLTKATVGNDLQTVRNTSYNPDAQFTSVEGPAGDNKAVRIPVNCYFLANHGMIPQEGKNVISEYTLFYEFKIPKEGIFYSLFQTELTNTGDAEIFIRGVVPPTIGVGATGYQGAGLIKAEQWHRLYLSFKPGGIKFFIDGKQFLSSTSKDARFNMNLDGVILCGGPWAKKDDNEMDIAEMSIWNGALTLEQIQELEGIVPEIE